jgi:hypothetical protein
MPISCGLVSKLYNKTCRGIHLVHNLTTFAFSDVQKEELFLTSHLIIDNRPGMLHPLNSNDASQFPVGTSIPAFVSTPTIPCLSQGSSERCYGWSSVIFQ